MSTKPSASQSRPRWLEAARIAWGVWLWAPGGAAIGLDVDDRTARAVHLAGLRQTAQGLLSAARPTPGVLRGGGYVDLIHAVTMIAAGAVLPSRRRLLLADSLIAAAWGAAGLKAARA